MPVVVEVTLNAGGAQRLVDQFKARASDFRPVFRGRFHEAVGEFFRRQWETEGTHGGVPWPPPSPTTLALRRKAGIASTKPLWATGRLRASWVEPQGESTLEVGPLMYQKRSTVEYGAKHMRPHTTLFRGQPRFVPARPILPPEMPKRVVSQWEKVLLEYVLHGWATESKSGRSFGIVETP